MTGFVFPLPSFPPAPRGSRPLAPHPAPFAQFSVFIQYTTAFAPALPPHSLPHPHLLSHFASVERVLLRHLSFPFRHLLPRPENRNRRFFSSDSCSQPPVCAVYHTHIRCPSLSTSNILSLLTLLYLLDFRNLSECGRILSYLSADVFSFSSCRYGVLFRSLSIIVAISRNFYPPSGTFVTAIEKAFSDHSSINLNPPHQIWIKF